MPIFARKCAKCGKKFKTRFAEITLCPDHILEQVLPPKYKLLAPRRSPLDTSVLMPHVPPEYAQVANRHKPFRAEYLFQPSVPPSSVMPQKDPPSKDPPPKKLPPSEPPPYPVHRHGKPEKGSNSASDKAEEERKKANHFKMLWLEELENFDFADLKKSPKSDTSKLQDSSPPSCTRETGELETEKPNLKTEMPDLETQNAVLETYSRETETAAQPAKLELSENGANETKPPSDEINHPVGETKDPVCEIKQSQDETKRVDSETSPPVQNARLRTCRYCGKQFALAWRMPRKFCSNECKHKYESNGNSKPVETDQERREKTAQLVRTWRPTRFALALLENEEVRERERKLEIERGRAESFAAKAVEEEASAFFVPRKRPPKPTDLPMPRYCKQCGKQFMPICKDDDNEFCSADCYAWNKRAEEVKREEKKRLADFDRMWNEHQKQRCCPICHTWFMPSKKERRKQIYCSHNCAVKAAYRKKHPEADPLRRASDFDMVRRVYALPPAERWKYAKDFTPEEKHYMLKLAKESGYFDSRNATPLDLM